ncbi:hypothetical protein [Streptomyces sp. NPDC048527]|uniref:hypothetical protein n=1 Tax=Streptomyces sp. NPDC048527 TaxID=3365568 RepID=UPI0037103C6A
MPTLAEWLRRECAVDLDSSWLSVLLQRDAFRFKCTRDSLRHHAAVRERLEGLRHCG